MPTSMRPWSTSESRASTSAASASGMEATGKPGQVLSPAWNLRSSSRRQWRATMKMPVRGDFTEAERRPSSAVFELAAGLLDLAAAASPDRPGRPPRTIRGPAGPCPRRSRARGEWSASSDTRGTERSSSGTSASTRAFFTSTSAFSRAACRLSVSAASSRSLLSSWISACSEPGALLLELGQDARRCRTRPRGRPRPPRPRPRRASGSGAGAGGWRSGPRGRPRSRRSGGTRRRGSASPPGPGPRGKARRGPTSRPLRR